MSDDLLRELDALAVPDPEGQRPKWVSEVAAEAAARVRELETKYEDEIQRWRNACALMNRAEAELEQERVGRERDREVAIRMDVALRAERDDARRTAEYWKAEHLSGNAVIDALRALLRSIDYRLNGSQDVCVKSISADIDAALKESP